jgi:tetratricopeptide (TPR) repeat protein
MSRWVLALLALSAALGPRGALADDLKKERPKDTTITKEEVPKEEDENLGTKEYSFNPLQAEKEVRVGEYYFKKGSYRAAALRFREATKWNQGYGEAWLRLGETAEKQKDAKTVKEAYAKYLEVAPDAKDAAEIRKKLEKLK